MPNFNKFGIYFLKKYDITGETNYADKENYSERSRCSSRKYRIIVQSRTAKMGGVP
jgi:hypothetical protein